MWDGCTLVSCSGDSYLVCVPCLPVPSLHLFDFIKSFFLLLVCAIWGLGCVREVIDCWSHDQRNLHRNCICSVARSAFVRMR